MKIEKWRKKGDVRADVRTRTGKETGEEQQDEGEHMTCGKRGKRNEVVCEMPQEGLSNTAWLLTGQKWK